MGGGGRSFCVEAKGPGPEGRPGGAEGARTERRLGGGGARGERACSSICAAWGAMMSRMRGSSCFKTSIWVHRGHAHDRLPGGCCWKSGEMLGRRDGRWTRLPHADLQWRMGWGKNAGDYAPGALRLRATGALLGHHGWCVLDPGQGGGRTLRRHSTFTHAGRHAFTQARKLERLGPRPWQAPWPAPVLTPSAWQRSSPGPDPRQGLPAH